MSIQDRIEDIFNDLQSVVRNIKEAHAYDNYNNDVNSFLKELEEDLEDISDDLGRCF